MPPFGWTMRRCAGCLRQDRLPAVGCAPVWAAITWRAFGHLWGVHNLGSRPEDLRKPYSARSEERDEHALRLGAWAALFTAESELKALVLEKQVTIYGRQEGLEPGGQPSFMPAGLHVLIPPEIFLNSRWIFDQSGRLHERPCDGPTVVDGRPVRRELWFFDVRVSLPELVAAWNAEANASNQSTDILVWMTNAAETFCREKNAKPKRDTIVKDCVRALGCRYEDAEAAFIMLPDCLRRKRGESVRKVKLAGWFQPLSDLD